MINNKKIHTKEEVFLLNLWWLVLSHKYSRRLNMRDCLSKCHDDNRVWDFNMGHCNKHIEKRANAQWTQLKNTEQVTSIQEVFHIEEKKNQWLNEAINDMPLYLHFSMFGKKVLGQGSSCVKQAAASSLPRNFSNTRCSRIRWMSHL